MNTDIDLILHLRGIHAPPDPSWWPPAPGWWLVAGLVIGALWVSARWLPPHWARLRMQWRMQHELKSIIQRMEDSADTARAAAELSLLLRRAVILRTRDVTVAGTQGEAWIERLAAHVPEATLHAKRQALLTELPYRAQVSEHDVVLLASLVQSVVQARIHAGGPEIKQC